MGLRRIRTSLDWRTKSQFMTHLMGLLPRVEEAKTRGLEARLMSSYLGKASEDVKLSSLTTGVERVFQEKRLERTSLKMMRVI